MHLLNGVVSQVKRIKGFFARRFDILDGPVTALFFELLLSHIGMILDRIAKPIECIVDPAHAPIRFGGVAQGIEAGDIGGDLLERKLSFRYRNAYTGEIFLDALLRDHEFAPSKRLSK